MNKIKTPKNLNIISYNLKYHRAFNELEKLAKTYQADVICMQECYSELLPNAMSGLKLADSTKINRLGLAIFYNPSRFKLITSKSFRLKKSMYEKLVFSADERLLITKLFDKHSRQYIALGSFHATPLFGSNHIRRHQIETAHQLLSKFAFGTPAIMVGDYNYPLFRRGLKVCIEQTGYELNFSDRPTYAIAKLLKAHFDLTTSINATIGQVKTLPKGLSDHAPILVKALI